MPLGALGLGGGGGHEVGKQGTQVVLYVTINVLLIVCCHNIREPFYPVFTTFDKHSI